MRSDNPNPPAGTPVLNPGPGRFLALAALFLALGGCADPPADPEPSAPETDSRLLLYDLEEGHIRLTGYTGTDQELILPDAIAGNPVRLIGKAAFRNRELRGLRLPQGITHIQAEAFSGNLLTALIVPPGVEEIHQGAFARNALSVLALPESLTLIGDQAFWANRLEELVIPGGVTSIGDGAFMSNRLSSLRIAGNIPVIGVNTFMDNRLTAVTIPASVQTLGGAAFSHNSLTSIALPANIAYVDIEVFKHNPLTRVWIPRDGLDLFTDSQVFGLYDTAFFQTYAKLAGWYYYQEDSQTWTKEP